MALGHIEQSLILRLTQPPLPLRIEAANDAFPNHRCFSGIVGLSHSRGETRQLFAGEFSFRVELIGKSNNARLIFRIESLDLFDDLISSHDLMLTHTAATFNLFACQPKIPCLIY